MATLTVTAANVNVISGATVANLVAGEAITPGEVLYKKASDSKAYLADANVTSAEAAAVGIAINYAETDRIVYYVSAGDLDVGATTTKAVTYFVSATAGSIDDTVASSSFSTVLGYAQDTAGTFTVDISISGQQKA